MGQAHKAKKMSAGHANTEQKEADQLTIQLNHALVFEVLVDLVLPRRTLNQGRVAVET